MTDDRQPHDPEEITTRERLTRDLNTIRETLPVAYVRDAAIGVVIVCVLMLSIVYVSGVYPPFAVVTSNSMGPHIQTGDMVLLIEEDRFSAASQDEAIVTYREGVDQSHRSHGSYGTVISFSPESPTKESVIHRARFKVAEGENWYHRADKEFIEAESCKELLNCPAPNAGYITKGDNNPIYDQALGMYDPITPSMISGKVKLSFPSGKLATSESTS
jgi:signal peptidase